MLAQRSHSSGRKSLTTRLNRGQFQDLAIAQLSYSVNSPSLGASEKKSKNEAVLPYRALAAGFLILKKTYRLSSPLSTVYEYHRSQLHSAKYRQVPSEIRHYLTRGSSSANVSSSTAPTHHRSDLNLVAPAQFETLWRKSSQTPTSPPIGN
jgi:hypothetical protein